MVHAQGDRKPTRRGLWRRLARFASLTLVLLSVYVVLFGWTARITPPAQPTQPVTVLWIADQLHRGLLLPRATTDGGGYVEFGFGDWHWYALANESWSDVFATVLWPTPGALARREVRQPDADAVRRVLSWARLHEVQVASADVASLLDRLEAQFTAGGADVVHRSELRMSFVPWTRSYWFVDNCSVAVGQWLEELGCTVAWAPLTFDLRSGDAR